MSRSTIRTWSSGRSSSRQAGLRRGRAEDVLADGEQRAHQVGADEAAGAQHEDRALQPPDFVERARARRA